MQCRCQCSEGREYGCGCSFGALHNYVFSLLLKYEVDGIVALGGSVVSVQLDYFRYVWTSERATVIMDIMSAKKMSRLQADGVTQYEISIEVTSLSLRILSMFQISSGSMLAM